MKGLIYLEDGSFYKGEGFGASATHVGELVFNTAMTGYQKTLTDPSYSGQMIVMTYPLLGNYGVNAEDYESEKIHALGAVCQDLCMKPSNHRSIKTIDQWPAFGCWPSLHTFFPFRPKPQYALNASLHSDE